MDDQPRNRAKPGKPQKKRRNANEIMNGLLAAATAEFTENGYAGATTAAIARRGAVTEAQLFRYFPSKADLFRESVFRPMSEHIGRFVGGAIDAAPDEMADRDRAGRYMAELRQFLQQHAPLLRTLIAARDPTFGSSSLDSYFARGAASLAEGLGKGADTAPDLMVRVSFAAVLACVLLEDWLFPAGLATKEAIGEAIEVFVVNGVAARK